MLKKQYIRKPDTFLSRADPGSGSASKWNGSYAIPGIFSCLRIIKEIKFTDYLKGTWSVILVTLHAKIYIARFTNNPWKFNLI